MQKIYYLSSCDTCKRIIKEINLSKEVELQDIKVSNIDADALDWIKSKVGSYEALFSKRAIKFRSLGLNKMTLADIDYRKLILEEYTFLKRPFIINGEKVFIGNAKKDVLAAKESFSKELI